jgi:TRAP-type uncharacterized transport system substrate-binding protein
MRSILIACAVALGVVAVALGAGYVIGLPVTLKLAVPTNDTASRKLLETAAEQFRSQRRPLRLEIVPAADPAAALAAVEQGHADLAVARAEEVLRAKVQTALIIRQEAAVIMTAKTSKVKKFADIVGANVGIVREGPANSSAFKAVLDYYALDPGKLKVTPLAPGDVATAFRAGRVDVLIVVGNPTSKAVADVVADAQGNAKGGIRFLAVDAAEAIAKRVPELDSIEFKQGIFGGRPPQPPEEIAGVGYSIRLVASERMSDDRMSDLLRQLLAIRQSLGAALPGAGLVKLPSKDDDSTFVIHPGVLTYGDGEQKTFFDRYNDWIYIAMMVASGIGSATAGLFGWLDTKRRRRTMSSVFEIERLIESVKAAETGTALDALAQQVDGLFGQALRQAVDGTLDHAGLETFKLALNEARSRIDRRRNELADTGPNEATARLRSV